MASSQNLNNQANGSRLSRLLINKGTQAFKTAFDVMYPPATLAMELNKNKKTLQGLRYKVINTSQWKLLYPAPPGSPDSKNFDVTLLTILFRNICGLTEPTAGWNVLPPDSDTSIADNIARIKFYRNEVYGHITTTEIDDDEFEKLWEKISKALIIFGISSSEIDELKEAPLSPEEDDYIQELKEWYKKEVELKKMVLDGNADVKVILTKVCKLEESQEVLMHKLRDLEYVSEVDELGKCNFTGKIESLNEKFLPGTRQWLFDKLTIWFTSKDSNSRVMILTADPGFGKSVFAAEVCKMYAGQLAACHFCQYNQTDCRNPRMIIESLASIMCDNVSGFKAKLSDLLKRRHSKETLSDAFRVFINDPLHALEDREPMLLVIDALDESEVEGKSKFLELISDEFPKLPSWIKILITTRPELPVQEKLEHLNPVQIAFYDEKNTEDLLMYLQECLSPICDDDRLLKSLAWECRGSFLYAYHAQVELNKTKQLTEENISKLLPKGICDFYEKQMEKLRNQLKTLNSSEINLKPFLEILAAAEGPLPLSLLPECLGLPDNAQYKVREAINEVMSTILPVYEDCLIVYHKSLIDWLISDGFKEYGFTVDCQSGHEFLWRVCEKEFTGITSLDTFCNFEPSPMTKYALRHGISHMIRSGSKINYHWSVNVKIVHARTMIVDYKMKEEWLEIIKNSFSSLCKKLVHEMKWHIRLFERHFMWPKPSQFYLQSVANRVDCNSETRSLARSLLRQSRYFWFEDLNTTEITNNLRMSVSLRTDVTCIGVSPNEQLVAVGYKDGWISIFNVPDFKELRTFNTMLESKSECSTIFDPDNSMLLYDKYDQLPGGMRQRNLPFFGGDYGALWSCSFSPSGNRLVTCDGSEEIKLWDVNSKNLLRRLQAGGPVDCCCFSDCGLFIVASKERVEDRRPERNDVFTVWNALTMQRVDRRNIRNIERSIDPFGICVIQQRVALPGENKNSQLFLSSSYGNDSIDSIDVFQLPDALLAARLRRYFFPLLLPVTRYHWRDCVLHHINQSVGLFSVKQLETLVLQKRWYMQYNAPVLCFSGCPCRYLKATRVVPVKVQNLYVVPVFAKLNILSAGPQTSKSIQPSFVLEPCVITSCCFSPDGSFLATCANGDPLSVVIWDTMICTIVDVLQLPLKSISACWWSDGLLWMYDGSVSLFKITISNTGTLASDAQEIQIDWKPSKLLTFSNVLIFIDQKNSVNVARIVKGKLQYIEKFSVDNSSISAAVAPSNSVILTVTFNTFSVWKENQSSCPHWVVLNIKELPDCLRENADLKCCITTDGSRGVLASFPVRYIVVVELESSKMLQVIRSSTTLVDIASFYVGNSYCIGVNRIGGSLVAETLSNGKVVAEWSKLREFDLSFSWIVAHSKNNLVAIISSQCSVQFLKIVVPE